MAPSYDNLHEEEREEDEEEVDDVEEEGEEEDDDNEAEIDFSGMDYKCWISFLSSLVNMYPS